MPTDPHAVCDKRSHRNSVLRELRELQSLAFADANAEGTKPNDRAALMRAYVLLEDSRRVLRMRPAPKPIDTTMLAKRKRADPGLGKTRVSRAKPDATDASPAAET